MDVPSVVMLALVSLAGDAVIRFAPAVPFELDSMLKQPSCLPARRSSPWIREKRCASETWELWPVSRTDAWTDRDTGAEVLVERAVRFCGDRTGVVDRTVEPQQSQAGLGLCGKRGLDVTLSELQEVSIIQWKNGSTSAWTAVFTWPVRGGGLAQISRLFSCVQWWAGR